MGTILEQEEKVSDAISPDSIQLSGRVRLLASALRDKTEASPFAAEALVLSNEVNSLCDCVERLHKSVETLLAMIDVDGTSASVTSGVELTAEDKKAMEIQREIHEFNPAAKDTIKALFMWRDSPGQRLRDGE